MSNRIQIEELNTYVKTRIAPSEIHGVGVVALRDIHKGERVYADNVAKGYSLPYSNFGKLFPEVKEHILEQWPNVINGSVFFYPTIRIQAYMNHSDDPNYDPKTDVALKDIKKGEEITEDYRTIENAEKVFSFLKSK
jgi:SET domain-containing protein